MGSVETKVPKKLLYILVRKRYKFRNDYVSG